MRTIVLYKAPAWRLDIDKVPISDCLILLWPPEYKDKGGHCNVD